MHLFHDSKHGFWRMFISLNYFRSKRQDHQRTHHDDQRGSGSRPDYEEHVGMREPTHDAFARTPRKARSVPRKDRSERTEEKGHKKDHKKDRSKRKHRHDHKKYRDRSSSDRSREWHRDEKHNRRRHSRRHRSTPRGRSPQARQWDLPESPESAEEPRSQRGPDLRRDRRAASPQRAEPTHRHHAAYQHGHQKKREGLLSRVIVIVSQQFSSSSSTGDRHRHRELRSPSPLPPSTSRRSTRRSRRRRTRPPEHNEERDDSFDIRRRTGLPSLDPIRHDPPVVDLPVYDVKIEPASLDNEIVVELAELDDLPNHDLPRDNRSEAEPLIKNDDNTDLQSSENEIRVIVLSDHDDDEPEEIVVELSEHQDDNPDEAPDQPTTTPQEPRDNPPSPSPPPSLSFSSSSSSSFSPPSPSPSTTATEYTTGGPSPWDDLPAPSQRLLARYAIPRDASFAHWDGASRPFAVWSSVFDARALGDWIYGWAAATHQDLAAVARFRATLARLARNVATATEAQTQIGPRLRDGADLLDEVEALVRVCQGPMVGPRERERYCARRPGADDGRIPVLGPGAARAFVDTLLGRADFWLVEEAARAWNGWFARWWHRGGGGDEEYEVFLEARERL